MTHSIIFANGTRLPLGRRLRRSPLSLGEIGPNRSARVDLAGEVPRFVLQYAKVSGCSADVCLPSVDAGAERAGPRGLLVRVRLGKALFAELRRGRTNREIASKLGISTPTVNKHVQHVLKKLRVTSRSQAVARLHAEAAGRPYT